MVYIFSFAAYLWDYMKDHEFTREELVKRIMEHYTGVTEEKVEADIDKFLKILGDNNILDDGVVRGSTFVRIPKDVLDKLWSKDGLPGGCSATFPKETRCSAEPLQRTFA